MSFQRQHLTSLRLIAFGSICYALLSTCVSAQTPNRDTELLFRNSNSNTSTSVPLIFSIRDGGPLVQLVANYQACRNGCQNNNVCTPNCVPVAPAYPGNSASDMGSPTGSPSVTDGGQNPLTTNPGQPPSSSSQYDLSPNFNAPDSGGIGNPNYVAAAAIPGGYLDMAAPVTQFRLRYDDALNNKYPDRGEYFYAECGCFRSFGNDRDVKGPPGNNISSVNYQDVRSYFEYAFNSRVSAFAEIAGQWDHFVTDTNPAAGNPNNNLNNPNLNNLGNSSGLGDMNAGFKYAFLAKPTEYFTFQLRTYIPTGDPGRGLGTGHVSIEPSLLYYKRLTNHWLVQGQLTEWTPINVTGFASDVLEYGGGLGYILWRGERVVVTPTIESVGWTFLGGRKFNPATGTVGNGNPSATGTSAAGDTIVNIKPGVRIGLSDLDAPSGQQRHSLYFGWGHALTSQQFYADIYRVEYRILF